MSDVKTIAAYDVAARRYAEAFALSKDTDQSKDFATFVAAVRPGGLVLDLGCGPGHFAARLRDAGLKIEASDASAEMVAFAKSEFGIEARHETFDQFEDAPRYDGIWANFSLLHLPKRVFPQHLGRVIHALTPGGVLMLGMKIGEGEQRDSLGRFYAYYSEEELRGHLERNGLTVTYTRTGNGEGLVGGPQTFVTLIAHA